MIAGAGHGDEMKVALDHHHFGGGVNAGEPQPGGEFARVDHPAFGQPRLLRMLDDALAKGLGIAKCPAHDPCIRHRLEPVGKGQRAALRQQAHLHQIFAQESLRDGAIAIDLGAPRLPGAPRDEFHGGDVVDDGIGIGQADHAGDAAGRRGLGAAGDGLHMLLARLAQLHAHVHQAGRQAMALAAYHLAALGQAVASHRRPDFGDASVDHQQPALFVAAAGRIEQASAQQGERPSTLRHRRPRWTAACASARRGRPFARRRPFPPVRG